MNKLFATLTFLLLASISYAQSHRVFAQAAYQAVENGDCHTAVSYFQQAIERKPTNLQYQFDYGLAAMECKQYALAENTFQDLKENIPEAYIQLGLSQKNQGKYRLAQKSFFAYIKKYPKYPLFEKAKFELANIEHAIITSPDKKYTIQHLGEEINTPYSEFAPTLINDTLFYSSFRFKDSDHPEQRISKAVFATKDAKNRPIKNRFNPKNTFVANVCFLPNGIGVYYNQCHYTNGQQIQCDLYYKEKTKKNRWSKPQKLAINQKGSTTTQPSYYLDNQSNKEYILFSSDRPGGLGGLDIWMAQIDKNHELIDPINFKNINKSSDEITPFYDSIDHKLYLSSTSYRNIGGFDIFYTNATRLPVPTATITPLPKPINTYADDFSFVINQDHTTGFFASNREGAMYIDKKNKRCCYDLYEWHYPAPPPPIDVPSTPIVTADKTPKPPTVHKPPITQGHDVIITSIPPHLDAQDTIALLKAFLPLSLYFDNDEPDKRTTATTTKKQYLETLKSYRQRKDVFIDAYCQNQSCNLLQDFFDYQLPSAKVNLTSFSTVLLEALQHGQKLKITIKGFTSPRAQSKYNEYLSSRRISSVKNHFYNFQDGALMPFIQSGNLQIHEIAFGEYQAPNQVNDELNNRRLSIFSLEASLERRVEILEIVEQ